MRYHSHPQLADTSSPSTSRFAPIGRRLPLGPLGALQRECNGLYRIWASYSRRRMQPFTEPIGIGIMRSVASFMGTTRSSSHVNPVSQDRHGPRR
jgi:hypothetical protein